MTRKSSPCQFLIDRFRARTPMRVASLLISFYGDAVAPRGGEVATATLLRFTSLFGLEQGAVRVALHRLAREGYLENVRQGRQAFFRIPDKLQPMFARAGQRIYRVQPDAPLPPSTLYLLHDRPQYDASEHVRQQMRDASCAPYQSGVWLTLSDHNVDIDGCLRIEINPPAETLAVMVEKVWPAYAHAEPFDDFMRCFSALSDITRAQLSPSDAMILRVMLVHDLRRILLKLPALPKALAPEGWGEWPCRDLARNIYSECIEGSEDWLDEHGLCLQGHLPKMNEEVMTLRFK